MKTGHTREMKKFMLDQSWPLPGMIDLVRGMNTGYALNVAAVNNEGRKLSMHRIKTFDPG